MPQTAGGRLSSCKNTQTQPTFMLKQPGSYFVVIQKCDDMLQTAVYNHAGGLIFTVHMDTYEYGRVYQFLLKFTHPD